MFNYLVYRLGQSIALALPLNIAYKFAIFIADIHCLFAKEDCRAIDSNLRAIFPYESDKNIRKIRINTFRNFAKYLVDFFRFSKITPDFIKKNIHLENKHYVDTALSKGKGVIALTAHLGNWELGGVVIALLGYPFSAVALPHKNKNVDNFFNSQRGMKGVKIIPLGKAVIQCLRILKKNEVLALVGDRDFSEKGIILDFFNKPTFFPEGPAAFALKTGAAIVPGFMIRNKNDSFTLRFEKPIENINLEDDKNTALKKIISYYKIIFEDYIRKYPDQWYMFRRFWIS